MTSDARVQLDYQMLVEQLPGAVYRAAPGARGAWFYVNAKVEQITGVAALEIELDPERWLSLVHADDRAAVLTQEERVAATGEPFLAEYRIVRPDGTIVWVRDEAIVLRDDAAGPVLQGVLLDITDRKQVELEIESSVTEQERLHEDLHQSHKLEAVGRLAGGIAHDFNNILTVIANYANFISEELDERDTLRDDAAEIIRASNRAASLVRQLLTFSRKDVSRPRVLDFNEVIADTERLLRRTIEEDIEIGVNTMDESVYVLMDPEKFEQVLLNLGLNARDAMPNGGKLTVAASLVDFDEPAIAFLPDVAVGSYACVIVGDTGEGMDDEVKSHIFEPFFTTKGRDRGTGLGLASVYGIVKKAGGHVGVESEKGRGSTFYVYLPLTDERPAAEVPSLAPHPATEGGRVAVVEDEEPVRRLVSRILERAGYEVLAVKSGLEATDLILADGHFNLLVTDVVMPEISGVELADRLTGEQPGLKVLLMSGYADVDLSRDGLADTDRSLLVKPFGKVDLLTKVRELIP